MAEKEYIERGALIENVKRVYCTDCNNYNEIRCRACGTDDALDMIEDAPAADVVEVVRCKDCKHWNKSGTGWRGILYGYCHNVDNDGFPFHCEQAPTTKGTDFCSYGERRGQPCEEE